MKPNLSFLVLFSIAFVPTVALANAGTPLMWATMLHLALGNILIGLIEGLLLAWLFKTPRWKSIGVLIAANYVSAWAGALLGNQWLSSLVDITIENLQIWFWFLVGIAFLMTLILEFPFFFFLLRKKVAAISVSLRATLFIHGMSYLLLFGWYWLASGTSMLTELDVVSAEHLQPHKEYALYFLTADGNQVIRSDLRGKSPEKVKNSNATHRSDRLFVRRDDAGKFDLWIYLHADQRGGTMEQIVLPDFASLAILERRIAEGYADTSAGTWANFGPVPKLTSEMAWTYRTGVWPVEGVSGNNNLEKLRFHYSLETPFVAWTARNAVHLDGGFVVFQLGADQICILQPQTRKIALIARGKGPVVAKQEIPN